jgi:hypothetical protein
MRLAIIAVLAVTLEARAQTPPTVYQQVFTNITTTQASAPVRNIGQTSHLVLIRWTNQTGQTCGTTLTDNIGLEFSADNVNYSRAGNIANFSALTQVIYARGNFPYIRLNARTFDTTRCQVTANYTGTFSEASVTGPLLGITENIQTITASGSTSLIATPGANAAIVIYGLTLWNAGASQNPLSLTCGTNTGVTLNTFPTGTGFFVPLNVQTGIPYARCLDNTALSISLSQAGQVNVKVNYQIE